MDFLKTLYPVTLHDLFLTPNDKPHDAMQHIMLCLVLNRAAFELGFTTHPARSWFTEYIEGRFARKFSDGKLHNEFFRWAYAVYALHNDLRHQEEWWVSLAEAEEAFTAMESASSRRRRRKGAGSGKRRGAGYSDLGVFFIGF